MVEAYGRTVDLDEDVRFESGNHGVKVLDENILQFAVADVPVETRSSLYGTPWTISESTKSLSFVTTTRSSATESSLTTASGVRLR